jgi:hypothetical protein
MKYMTHSITRTILVALVKRNRFIVSLSIACIDDAPEVARCVVARQRLMPLRTHCMSCRVLCAVFFKEVLPAIPLLRIAYCVLRIAYCLFFPMLVAGRLPCVPGGCARRALTPRLSDPKPWSAGSTTP